MSKKLTSIMIRVFAGVLATTAAIAICLNAALWVYGTLGTLSALSYTIADSIDLYGLICS